MMIRLTGTLAVFLALLLETSFQGVNGMGPIILCPLDAMVGDSCDDGQGICVPPSVAMNSAKGRLKCYATPCSAMNVTYCAGFDPVDNGYYMLDDPTYAGVNATASLHCCNGYNTTGETLVCGEDGQWSAASATCDIICCGAAPSYRSRVPNYITGDCFMDILTFSCPDFLYPYGGAPASVCLGNGMWLETGFYCDE